MIDDSMRLGVSLFSGSGLGDLGLRAAGIRLVALCDVDPRRADVARTNYPDAHVAAGDLSDPDFRAHYVDLARARLAARGIQNPFVVSCSPPCQGMSKSGQGTLLRNIRAGKRPKLDPRNRLILAGLDVIAALEPTWVIFENVIEMQNTVVEDRVGKVRPILEIVRQELSPSYVGGFYPINFADYGIPQRRQRLISVFTRDPIGRQLHGRGERLVPQPTHGDGVPGLPRWRTVRDCIAHFPPLDAKNRETAVSDIPFHRVPVLDERKYEWVRWAGPRASAFDNQCVNPACRFDANPTHRSRRTQSGINQASKMTPINCEACGSPLPRPTAKGADGTLRLMSGYTSAYKRMAWDKPAPAITRNLSYACSDHKLHPEQHRVLSLAEAFAISSLDSYDYRWEATRAEGGPSKPVTDTLVRLLLGEGIPPAFMEALGRFTDQVSSGRDVGVTSRHPTAGIQAQLSLV